MEKANDYKETKKTENKNEYEVFGERLNYVMKIRSVTNQNLAERLFISTSTVSGYRTGKRCPHYTVIAQICRELSVSADYMLGLSEHIDL